MAETLQSNTYRDTLRGLYACRGCLHKCYVCYEPRLWNFMRSRTGRWGGKRTLWRA